MKKLRSRPQPVRSGTIMSSPEAKQRFRRNYKACLNCRLRKVKCELGSVDSPIEGKCARCRRERKDCVFVDSRRGQSHKRRKGDTGDGTGLPGVEHQLPSVSNILGPFQHQGQPQLQGQAQGQGQSQSQGQFSSSPVPTPAPHASKPFSSYPNLSAYPQQYSLQSNLVSNDSRLLSSQSLAQVPQAPGELEGPSRPGSTSRPDSTRPGESRKLTPKDEGHFSTMEGALVYLAKAAGTIAKADERDNIDANEKHQLLERNLDRSRAGTSSDGSNHGTSAGSQPSGPKPANSSPMSQKPGPKYNSLLEPEPHAVPKHIQNQSNFLSIPITNEFLIRPKGSNRLSNIDYIGENGLLTEFEAEMLINLFFTTMHPYFPHIPLFLHKPQVLAGYPILLCAILTIASRYHSLDDNPNNITTGNVDGVPRNIEIHDKLWLYVQRLISQTVWAEASTRSIGTIFAFLLLTEWNPRAIHWRWTDYANVPEDNRGQMEENGPNNEQTLAGLGAMRRSYRMAWMLIGSAVRLAQDMGFMDVSPKTFLATHVSEINGVMNISRRSMLSYSLSEVEIDEDNTMSGDDDDAQLIDMTEEEIKEKSNEPMRFSFNQRAKIELLQIMSLSHESLYGHKAQLGSLSQRQNLAVLNIISPLINGWERKYRSLLRPSNHKQYNLHNSNSLLDQNSKLARDLNDCVEYEAFIFEFNYAKLYVYSLALSSSASKPDQESSDPTKGNRKSNKRVNLKLDEISKSAKYIEQAFFAADEMLAVAHRVHKLKTLRFMPVRWVTRIVRAVAFIVKCYLTITAHKKLAKTQDPNSTTVDSFDATILSLSLIPVDEIMFSIQKAAITLRDCSPDELHLCTRYSNVLMYLCSEMKTNSKNFNDSSSDPPSYRAQREGTQATPSFGDGLNFLENNINTYDKVKESDFTPTLNSTVAGGDALTQNDTPAFNNSLPGIDINSGRETPQGLIGDSDVIEWFINNKNVGLDFVAPWTEMIEQQLNSDEQFNFNNAFN